MPAAAVIPAPKVYLNVVAVKKLVVELLALPQSLLGLYGGVIRSERHSVERRVSERAFYFEEIRVLKASLRSVYISMG